MTIGAAPICFTCRHYRPEDEERFACAAYPAGIPMAIALSEVDHHQPYEGDNGIQYEPVDGGEWRLERVANGD